MLIQSSYIILPSKRSLKSYAGVDLSTYQILLKELDVLEQERLSELSNRPNRRRQSGGGTKSFLKTLDDKLLFILHYYKTYSTMDVLATHYGVSRSSIWNQVHGLSAVLHRILVKLEVMPMREMPCVEEFKAYLEAHKIHQLNY